MESNNSVSNLVQEQFADSYKKTLEDYLYLADTIINKEYLSELCKCEVDINNTEDIGNIRLFEVLRFTFDEDEKVNDKLISVYGALQDFKSAAVLLIDGKPEGVTFYIGARSKMKREANTAGKILQKGLLGNFPGTELRMLANSEVEVLMKASMGVEDKDVNKHVTCVTTVPSDRVNNSNSFVQGIEKFIETMICEEEGDSYTAVIIANPLEKSSLDKLKREYENIYSTLSSYSGQSLAYGENESDSVSEGMFENVSNSLSKSLSNTSGESSSQNIGSSIGSSSGNSSNGMFNDTISSGTTAGSSKGYSTGESWSKSVVKGHTETKGSGTNKTDTNTIGSSKTITINFENKSVRNILNKVEENLIRLKECDAFGLWECAAYFVSSNVQTSIVAANTYRALLSGENTSVENTYINQWSFEENDRTKEVLNYLSQAVHPKFYFNNEIIKPTTIISGKELPLIMGFPQKSVAGLTIVHSAAFGRNIYENRKTENQRKIKIGQIKHMGKVQNNDVLLNLDSFTSHCFITGSTGSGKSNTSYKLIEQFYKSGVKFLVIEPAKGEYRMEFANIENINILCTNPEYFRMLKLNPFKFPEGIHVLEHLDRLIEIFNACWEMTAAMPAILKESVEKAYIYTGWDIQNSVYRKEGVVHYPTFETVLNILPTVINASSYSAEGKGNYIGALVTRVNSLTNGISGQIFEDEIGIEDNIMFDENTIVDLSRVGSAETKSLIMGILILKLNEYRMSMAACTNSGLKHVTFIEEAHNILRRCDKGENPVLAKSVEMISNSIAEMRTYGEGFVIVDQSPGAVDISAIKNTNTKIVMRLPDYEDCLAVGRAASLSDSQINEIPRLGTGEAVITQNNWIEAVLTQIDQYTGENYNGPDEKTDACSLQSIKGQILCEYMNQRKGERYEPEKVFDIILDSELNRHKKAEFLSFWKSVYMYSISKAKAGNYLLGKIITNFLACQNMFDLAELTLQSSNSEDVDEEKVRKLKREISKLLDQYVIISDKEIKKDVMWCLLNYMGGKTRKSLYLIATKGTNK